jgi:hypothetical protein
MEARDRRVFDCYQRRIPLAFSMAGGYGGRSKTIQVLSTLHRVARCRTGSAGKFAFVS